MGEPFANGRTWGPQWKPDNLPGSEMFALKMESHKSMMGSARYEQKPMFQSNIRDLLAQIEDFKDYATKTGGPFSDWRPELRLWMRRAGGAVLENFKEGGTENGAWRRVKDVKDRDNPASRTLGVPPLTDWGDARPDPTRAGGNYRRINLEKIGKGLTDALRVAQLQRDDFIRTHVEKENERRRKVAESKRRTKGKGSDDEEAGPSSHLSLDALGDTDRARKHADSGEWDYITEAKERGHLGFTAEGYLNRSTVPQMLMAKRAEIARGGQADVDRAIKSASKAKKELAELTRLRASKGPKFRQFDFDELSSKVRDADKSIARARRSHEALKKNAETKYNEWMKDWRERKAKILQSEAKQKAQARKARDAKVQRTLEGDRTRMKVLDHKSLSKEDIYKANYVHAFGRKKYLDGLRQMDERIEHLESHISGRSNQPKLSRGKTLKTHTGYFRGLREIASNWTPDKYTASLARIGKVNAMIGVNTGAGGMPYAKYHLNTRPFMILPQKMQSWLVELVTEGLVARLNGNKSYQDMYDPDGPAW